METTKENKEELKEVLNETVEFYSEDVTRRGTTSTGACMYYFKDPKTKEVRKCAVGRMLKNKECKKLIDFCGGVLGLVREHPSIKFKKKYRNLPTRFLWDLQVFHDSQSYFNLHDGKGLTQKGTEEVEHILSRIEKGFYFVE